MKINWPSQAGIFSFISGNGLIIFILICGMVNNFKHNAEMYNMLGSGEMVGYLVVLFLDLGLIVLVVHNYDNPSKILTWILGLLNLFFWDILTDIYQFDAVIQDPKRLTLFLVKLIYFVLFPYLQHLFCDLYVKRNKQAPQLEQYQAQQAEQAKRISELEGELVRRETSRANFENRCHQLAQEVEELRPWREVWRKFGEGSNYLPDVNEGVKSMMQSYRAKLKDN